MLTAARPWPRFWARNIDVILFAVVIGILLAIFTPGFYELIIVTKNNDAVLGFAVMLCWIPVEAIALANWGTTPGKAMLGISVSRTDGRKLTFYEALSRSFLVWRKGAGCGLPLISLITCWVAYKKLKTAGSTTWDSELHVSVFQATMSITRVLISGAISMCLAALIILGNIAS
jgi:uncharacterized RDD family membrane protein YckC